MESREEAQAHWLSNRQTRAACVSPKGGGKELTPAARSTTGEWRDIPVAQVTG